MRNGGRVNTFRNLGKRIENLTREWREVIKPRVSLPEETRSPDLWRGKLLSFFCILYKHGILL